MEQRLHQISQGLNTVQQSGDFVLVRNRPRDSGAVDEGLKAQGKFHTLSYSESASNSANTGTCRFTTHGKMDASC